MIDSFDANSNKYTRDLVVNRANNLDGREVNRKKLDWRQSNRYNLRCLAKIVVKIIFLKIFSQEIHRKNYLR